MLTQVVKNGPKLHLKQGFHRHELSTKEAFIQSMVDAGWDEELSLEREQAINRSLESVCTEVY
jgi:hypothetical protein